MNIAATKQPLRYETQVLAFREQISSVENHHKLPEVFTDFWPHWYKVCRENKHDLYEMLQNLENSLFKSSDELLAHPLSGALCRALRLWKLQVRRHNSIASPREKQGHPNDSKMSLATLAQIWQLFQQNFISKLAEPDRGALRKAMAVPYSFFGLTIIGATTNSQRQNSISSGSVSPRFQQYVSEDFHSTELSSAKFHKTVGELSKAEKTLIKLLNKLQHNTVIFSSAMFELCDIYSQTEQGELFRQSIRKLLLQNSIHWDFTMVGSQFCQQLLKYLPEHISSEFDAADPIALNWGGLCGLAAGEYGEGNTLSEQQQKIYWGKILQFKKSISKQAIMVKKQEKQSVLYRETPQLGREFYSIQRAQLLLYYISILEHLNLAHSLESSHQALEENYELRQNVLNEVFSLSEDISQRCKNRFSY